MIAEIQIWRLVALISVALTAKLHAQLPNAWQIDDPAPTTDSTPHYTTNLPIGLQMAATNSSGGFRFSINARFVTDFSGAKSMAMAYVLGSKRFLIWFELNGSGDLVAELEGAGTYVLTTNGTGTVLFHTHEITYIPGTGTASYAFDGQVKASNWSPSATTLPSGQVYWGSGSSLGIGVMNFHSVLFEVTNTVVARYDAGLEPTNAPDPQTQGWTYTLVGAGAVSGVSPDIVPQPTLPTATLIGLEEIEPHQATVSWMVNQGNQAATTWFEWGPNTNYDKSSNPVQLLSDTNSFNISQPLNKLFRGTGYHIRCAASNLQGTAYSADAVFATPEDFIVTTLADSGYGSLRQSVSHAASGENITFATNGTITLTSGELFIANDLTINGPGPANLAIDGNGAHRILNIASSAMVNISALTITNGYYSNGGGIWNDGRLTINTTTISRNVANDYHGGGIYNNGLLVLNRSTLAGNAAYYFGGAIYNHGTLILNNSTISKNMSFSSGGGIYSDSGTNTLSNCTIAGNSAGKGGGIRQEDQFNGKFILTNTIVAGNTGNDPNISGSFGAFTIFNCLTAGDPLLAPLGNYGGPTPTMPLLSGSPAMDYGQDSVTSFLTTDQRGYPRKSGARVDIGAVEAQVSPGSDPVLLKDPAVSGNGTLTFGFTNAPNTDFTVLASTNLALPLIQWIPIGLATQSAPGQYEFGDVSATNYSQRFYQLVSP